MTLTWQKAERNNAPFQRFGIQAFDVQRMDLHLAFWWMQMGPHES